MHVVMLFLAANAVAVNGDDAVFRSATGLPPPTLSRTTVELLLQFERLMARRNATCSWVDLGNMYSPWITAESEREFLRGRPTIGMLSRGCLDVMPSVIREPLIEWRKTDSTNGASALSRSGGWGGRRLPTSIVASIAHPGSAATAIAVVGFDETEEEGEGDVTARPMTFSMTTK